MDWCGRRGWGLVMTCRRDMFPSDLDNKYLLSAREAVNKVNKVARFNNPCQETKNTGVSHLSQLLGGQEGFPNGR